MYCPTFSNTTPLPSNCCRFYENYRSIDQKTIDYCVEEPDNIIFDRMSCPSQFYDYLDCGDNVYIHYNTSLSNLSYGGGIRLEKWYWGHTRGTEDPGHVFLYSSNDCSGYHIDETSNGRLRVDGEDSQLLS